MSILIKGIDMPKDCEGCPCAYFTEGAYTDECQVTHNHITDEKPTDCPLIEIPTPHGRLIDGDWFIKQMKEYNPQTSKTKWAEIVAELAPIFLEAEG